MTVEEFLNLRTKVHFCSISLGHRCIKCKSKDKCKDYLLMREIETGRRHKKHE